MDTNQSFLDIPQESDFTLLNIPFGVAEFNNQLFSASRIGDFVINLTLIEQKGLFSKLSQIFAQLKSPVFTGLLNNFMALDRPYWKETRRVIIELFSKNSAHTQEIQDTFISINQVKLRLPCQIGDYTDYYSSRSHAYNVGCIIRGPENALQDNWLYLPVGYHGRSSSIVVSGTDVVRPWGQVKPPTEKVPSFTVCKRLDFELEIGAFIGGSLNKLGQPINANKAKDYVFGFVILNDWSARDIQTWEYVPLGPFGAKNFATSISPWIITCEALEAFKTPLEKQDPEPFEYLKEEEHISYDIDLSVKLNDDVITTSNFKYLYWSISQQLAHHTITGCNMNPGDLLGSGTISGPNKEQRGCLLEISWAGKEPITLKDGSKRTFLEDGDVVTMTGHSTRNGQRVGFGECSGKILSALKKEDFI